MIKNDRYILVESIDPIVDATSNTYMLQKIYQDRIIEVNHRILIESDPQVNL